jgi:hypothetical protein
LNFALYAVKLAIFAVIVEKECNRPAHMLINLIKSILVSPIDGWDSLDKSERVSTTAGFNLLVNLALIAGIISFVGISISSEGSFVLAIKYFGYISLKWLFSILFASWAIAKLARGFKGIMSMPKTLIIISLCSSILIISISLGHIFPVAKVFFYLLSSIGVVYYYFALNKLSGLSHERVPGFLLISLLVLALIVFIVEMVLVLIFNIPVHL